MFLDHVVDMEILQVPESSDANESVLSILPNPDFRPAKSKSLPYHHFVRPDQAAKEIISVWLNGEQTTSIDVSVKRLINEINAVNPVRVASNRLKIFTAILERVLQIGKQIGFDMEPFTSEFLSHLPKETRNTVARATLHSVGLWSLAMERRKRATEEEDLTGPVSKKLKGC